MKHESWWVPKNCLARQILLMLKQNSDSENLMNLLKVRMFYFNLFQLTRLPKRRWFQIVKEPTLAWKIVPVPFDFRDVPMLSLNMLRYVIIKIFFGIHSKVLRCYSWCSLSQVQSPCFFSLKSLKIYRPLPTESFHFCILILYRHQI